MLTQTHSHLLTKIDPDATRSAVAIAPGGTDKQSKVRMAVDWEPYATHIWIGPTREMNYSRAEATALLRNPERAEEILFEQYAAHTGIQVGVFIDWMIDRKNIEVLYLSTAKYHVPRLMLTFIRWWHHRGDDRKLYIVALPTESPDNVDPSIEMSQTVESEIDRIIKYYGKDVATEKMVKQFLST